MGNAFTHPSPVSEGDREVALGNEILRTVVGSEVFGMALPGVGDRDEMGVYVETPEQLLGLEPSSERYVSRTQPEGVRSGPGDVDLTIYGLRKYMRLVCAGNPTVLTPLFAPEEFVLINSQIGRGLREAATYFLSRQVGYRHLGYLNKQRERMVGGGRQSRVPKRPELIEAHGYDTKYASHALRLGIQGHEIMTTGTLTLPLSGESLEECLEVKRGEVDFDEALRRVDRVKARLELVIDSDAPLLPEKPNMNSINPFLVSLHKRHWNVRREF